jgi:hypothetical protein
MESLFSHLIAGLEGKDWRFVRDAEGRPTGFRLMYGASAETDKPGSI